MDFLKYFNNQAIEAYPKLNDSINNPNLELANTITAERINQQISKQSLAEKLNCKVEEITLIEAGLFRDSRFLAEIIEFLDIEAGSFRDLKLENVAIV